MGLRGSFCFLAFSANKREVNVVPAFTCSFESPVSFAEVDF